MTAWHDWSRVKSGQNYLPPAAEKKTQVEPNPVVPSSLQRSPFVAAGKVLFCANFAFKSLIFSSFWCIQRHPLEDLTSQIPNPPFYPSCFRCNNSAHGVGASKEGPAPLSRFLPSLILLELLERYTHLGHRDLLILLVDHRVRLLLVMSLNFKLHVPIMASGNPPFIIRDHLYSVDDRLKRGRPPPLLKGADEDVIIDEEPAPEATSVIDPASVSRCCIERGLFPAVPLFFQYPCSTSKGWSEWVDDELKNPSTRDILSRAGVLEAIFASKACDIHIEVKTLRHLVRRWSTETHTFICSWGEFTPMLEDVANIFHLPLCGSQDPFHIALTPEDGLKLETLRKGAPTSPSTSLRFSNWIQFFGNSDRDEPCRLAAFVSLWLGRFLFCDFSQDCLHGRVFPLALAIARGSMIPLAPMFLGHLYRLLDQIQFLEKGAAGTMAVETFVNSSFLQIFLWERFKGIEVSPLPYSKAESLVASDENSYMPGSLPLICRWFRRMQRKGQNFLELLDDVEQFIFRPYCASSEGFRSMPLYADSAALMEALAMPTQGCWLRREALLSAACLPLPTFGDDHLEISVHYSPYRVRRQLGFDQGVPSRPNHGGSLTLHRVFWTGDSVPGDGRPLALALASRQRVGSLSKAYQNYWNRCFASFSRFHAAHCDRLIPTIIHHARLVSEEKAISLSEKRNLPFISKSGEIVGDFSKLKRKLEKSGSHNAGKSAAHGKRKREESCSAEKRQAVKGPKRFIPNVAAGGPPSSRKVALPESLQQQPVASGSSERAAPKASSPHSTSQSKGKGKGFSVTPKRRSMRILETRFANTRKNKGEDSGPKVVVTVDDNSDDDSDDGGAAGTEADIHEQESARDTSGMDEDFDEGQYDSRDEDTYPAFGTSLGELDDSDTTPALTSDRGQRVDIELVVPTIEGTIGASSEADFALPTTVAEAVLSLPAVQPPPSPNPCTPDMAADASPPLSTVPPPISPIPNAPDIASGTAQLLPAVHPLTPPISSTPDITSGTAPPFPAAHPCAEMIDNSHKNGDAFIAGSSKGHSFEKGMSWQDWENSYTAFKAFFDGGVTILRSIDELLPLCHRFDGYATFQGALVYPETVGALKRFMDKHGSLMEATDVTSSFSRCTALRALGLVLHGMDTMQLLDITDHKLLCWRDAICEAMILGFPVEFLLKLVKSLARAVFGAQAIRSMQLSHDSDEVKAAADALNIKQQELENQRREMHALLLAKGISVDSAECVTEAAARLSPGASFVLFGH
ncbi:unnamed protein product [Prunus armeniaca]